MTRSGCVGSGMGGRLRDLAVEGYFDAGKDAKSGLLKTGRVLVVTIEQIVDPGEGGQAMAQIVSGGKVYDRVAVLPKARNRSVATDVGPGADINEGHP